jgi:hypothetical protein
MKKNRILTESQKKQIINDKQKNIIENFASVFNKIKRLNENELTNELPEEDVKHIIETIKTQSDNIIDRLTTVGWENIKLHGKTMFNDYEEIYNECGEFKYEFTSWIINPGKKEYQITVSVKFEQIWMGEYYRGGLETEEEHPEAEIDDVEITNIMINTTPKETEEPLFTTNNPELINLIKTEIEDILYQMNTHKYLIL